jgi:hypothetical protein
MFMAGECSLHFTCRPVNSPAIEIIRRDLKILAFISGHKVIIICVVILHMTHLVQHNIHYNNSILQKLGIMLLINK